eukprot:350193-Rhodomonas_salina.1
MGHKQLFVSGVERPPGKFTQFLSKNTYSNFYYHDSDGVWGGDGPEEGRTPEGGIPTGYPGTWVACCEAGVASEGGAWQVMMILRPGSGFAA